jgi:hypothetical protein
MAAGLGFKTFTTGEVLTAADTNGYLMQGVNVFANAAARTAAITSPQEGQMSFLKDTNSTEYYDGAAWQTVSTTGGQTLISTTTLTGASISLSSIPSSYNELILIIRDFLPASDGSTMRMQFNSDTGTNYQSTLSNSANIGNAQTFGQGNLTLASANDNAVANGLFTVRIPDYANAVTWKFATSAGITVDSTTTTSFRTVLYNHAYNQTAAITSIELFPSAGNFTSGTVLLYGVK